MDDALFLSSYFNQRMPHDSIKLLEIKLNLEAARYKISDSLLHKYFSDYSDSLIDQCTITLIRNHCYLEKGAFNSITDPSCAKHPTHRETWKIQLLISYLQQNKQEEFDMLFNAVKCSDPILSLAEFDLYVMMTDLKHHRFKKPILASLFSAIIPGSGKIYAGKPHESLMSFIPVAFNFAQTAEGYYYKKWESPHLYVFGSLTTVFYASGITGSYKSAKRKNEEYMLRLKDNIDFEKNKLIPYY